MRATILLLLLYLLCRPVQPARQRRSLARLKRLMTDLQNGEELARKETGTEWPASLPAYRPHESQYLGRPSPLLAKLLTWDKNWEELGPLGARLVGLVRDLAEHSDILQSIFSKEFPSQSQS